MTNYREFRTPCQPQRLHRLTKTWQTLLRDCTYVNICTMWMKIWPKLNQCCSLSSPKNRRASFTIRSYKSTLFWVWTIKLLGDNGHMFRRSNQCSYWRNNSKNHLGNMYTRKIAKMEGRVLLSISPITPISTCFCCQTLKQIRLSSLRKLKM